MVDRKVKVILEAEVAGAQAKIAGFGKSVGDTATKMTAAGKEGDKFRRGLDELGSTAGKVGLAAAAGLGAVVIASSNFESAMSEVQAATHETATNMDLLRDAAIKAGADTAFSASEAAAGIENLAKAGVSTADILGGGLSGALDLAAAGGLGVADAAEIAATALTQFKLEGEDVPHVADLLAAAAGKAQGEVSDMAFALKQSGLVASQMGLSIEETTGTLAAFASAGLLGSDAGTSFRTMLLRLANPTDEAAGLMSELGIAAYDANGQFVGMESIAGQLQKAFEGKTQAERDSAMATLFGSDAIRAAAVLYEQGAQGIGDWTTKVNDQGFAAETAAIKMDNLRGDMEALGGSVETALIKMGEGSQGPLRGLVQGLTGVVNAFGELPAPIQGTVTGLLGITAITGGGLWFGAKVISGISNTKDALNNLGISSKDAAGKLGSIAGRAAGIIAVATAVNMLGRALDDSVGNNVNVGNLSREIDALVKGGTPESLDAVADALAGVSEAGAGTVNAIFKLPGALVGMRTSFQKNQDAIAAFDEQLARLVEGGDPEAAAEVFARIAAAAEDQGISVEETRSRFEQYQLALSNAGLVSNTVTGGFRFLDGVLKELPATAQQAAVAQEELSEASIEAEEAARRQGGAWIGLGESVDDADVSLAEWTQSLRDQAIALEEFTANARTAAKRGLDDGLIASLKELGPQGALRMRQLAGATKAEIDRVNADWRRGERAIDDYVAKPVPPKKPKVEIGPAQAALASITAGILGIPDGHATIHVDAIASGALAGALVGGSLGRTAAKPRGFSEGGYTGDAGINQPVGVVHGKEYVFSAAATDGNVAMLETLHRQLRGYANGGFVTPTTAPARPMPMTFETPGRPFGRDAHGARPIVVEDRSGDPVRTAQEVVRIESFEGVG